MELKQNISFAPFLIAGLIAGVLLSVLHYSTNITSIFPSLWASFYALFFLFAHSYERNKSILLVSTLLASLLAALPLAWQFQSLENSINTPFSAILLSLVSAYALNTFNMHYQANQFKFQYALLFYAVWDTFVHILVALFFASVCWFLIFITDLLFRFLNISLIDQLISKAWFSITSTVLYLSIGLWIAATANQVIRSIRMILLLICRYLMIPLSLIGIVFFMGLVFKGMQTTTEVPYSLSVLMSFLSIVFINGIYQAGQTPQPTSALYIGICRAYLYITPFFPLLVLLFMVGKPLNVSHFQFLISSLILLAYNIAYAVIAFRSKLFLSNAMEKINIVFVFILIFITVCAFNAGVLELFPKSNTVYKSPPSTSIS